jgi:hypothetical protein
LREKWGLNIGRENEEEPGQGRSQGKINSNKIHKV